MPPFKAVMLSISLTEPLETVLATVKLPDPVAINAPVPLTAPFKVAMLLLFKIKLLPLPVTPERVRIVPFKVVDAPKVTAPP